MDRVRFTEVDSTSREARRRIEAGLEAATVFVAARQTGGVGRFGRAWASPAGGLWLTAAIPTERRAEDLAAGLGLRVGLAAVEAIEAEFGDAERVRLKWPNDVLIDGKKAAGILCEVVAARGRTWVVVGVGVNGNFGVDALPPEMRGRATTLREAVGADVELDGLLDSLLAGIKRAVATSAQVDAALLEAVSARMAGVGERATVTLADGAVVRGTLLGLGDDGRIRLATETGEFTPPFGAELSS
ncbi:MAG: biotin--[acetyl-CoA-carboxylase] ligase [Planctomycetota bacterium]|nr:biotin--[acetyl-CoA-carboxylase] ligase [Planctomycetota bacterium]